MESQLAELRESLEKLHQEQIEHITTALNTGEALQISCISRNFNLLYSSLLGFLCRVMTMLGV